MSDSMRRYWRLDETTASVRFSVRHLLISRTEGRFGRFTGALAFAEDAPETAEVEVHIDAGSIDTRDRLRDNELREFLGVAQYPEILFRATRVTRGRGGRRYRMSGHLTVRDVTREVHLDVEDRGRSRTLSAPAGEEAHFAARTTIDRRDFGLRWNRLVETGGVLVGDQIEVEITVRAVAVMDRTAAGFRSEG
ncbi:MAG TPA: YceI family protein [Polyangia bacterium]|jgi:polyisoprenoid-binding protein YceI|nr:YceI family protein [Polyangia bacterium]